MHSISPDGITSARQKFDLDMQLIHDDMGTILMSSSFAGNREENHGCLTGESPLCPNYFSFH